jgi:hypothetical protein
MTIKNTLTLAEYKAFVDTVVNAVFITTETGEMEYHPEYKDLFTKYAIIEYFTDYDFGIEEIDFEKFYELCFNDEDVQNTVYTVKIEKEQYTLLDKAISEAIEFKKNMMYKKSAYSLTDTILSTLLFKIDEIVDKIGDDYQNIDVKKLAETFTSIDGNLTADNVVDALAEKGFLSKPNRQTRRKNTTITKTK